MSIIISNVSYHYPNRQPLFQHLQFSIAKQSKVSLIGDNGMGKSTLLKLIAGQLQPTDGTIVCSSKPYYIPQHTGALEKTVAEVLGIQEKFNALQAIMNGSVSQSDYDILADDWDIEARCEAALAYWNIAHVKPQMFMDTLSGGERTKVLLAGLLMHKPEIILLDEPSNHLDQSSRKQLYQYIQQSTATLVIVSHDRTLLDEMQVTYELSEHGIQLYGGNYSFYQEQKALQVNALNEDIQDEEKALRLARKKAQEVKQRQEKRALKGEKNKDQVVRILRKTFLNAGENTASRLKGKHDEIISNTQERLKELSQINYAYQKGVPLWKIPLDFKLYSNDRIHITGDNGTGKTTFIRLVLDELQPCCGQITRAVFSHIYLDQNYTQVEVDCTVVQLAELYNGHNLKDNEIKLRLHRFLFPADTWDKPCKALSGGEKMRLYLCCLMISNHTPDLIILDEPTNNLDIASLQILTRTIQSYKGSILVISHDHQFVTDIGVTDTFALGNG